MIKIIFNSINKNNTNILMLVVMLLFIFLASYQKSYSFPLTTLKYTNCNPKADPRFDFKYNPNLYKAESTQPDPDLGILEDSGFFIQQSCLGHEGRGGEIDMNNFAVKVRFDTTVAEIFSIDMIMGLDDLASVRNMDDFKDYLESGAYAGKIGKLISKGVKDEFVKEFFLEVGKRKIVSSVVFSTVIEGDKVCVYASPYGIFNFPVNKASEGYYGKLSSDKIRINSFGNDIEPIEPSAVPASVVGNDAEDANQDGGLQDHCYFMPEPRLNLKLPEWPPVISPVCSNFCNKIDHDKNEETAMQSACLSQTENPFIGVLAQCVVETMDNIFLVPARDGLNMFGQVKERLKDIILTLLVLYVIIYAIQIPVLKRQVTKPELMWAILKMILVFYFATGDGLDRVRFALVNGSHELSGYFMNAVLGSGEDYDELQDQINDAKEDIGLSQRKLKNARLNIYEDDLALVNNLTKLKDDVELLRIDLATKSSENVPNTQLEQIRNQIDEKKRSIYEIEQQRIALKVRENMPQIANELKLKNEVLQDLIYRQDVVGYNYCDFRNVRYGDDKEPGSSESTNDFKTIYLPTGTGGELTIVRDVGYMRLWDTIDCRLARYLGIGDSSYGKHIPQVLMIGVSAVPTMVIGLVILILTITFLLYVMFLSYRICHIFLMAFIGLNILMIIGPVFIVAKLFKFTEPMFKAWMKQIIAYTFQTVILFAFLSFAFSIFDRVIYEGNYKFYPADYGDPYSTNFEERQKALLRNKIVMDTTNPDDPTNPEYWECPDKDALGCIYSTIKFNRTLNFGLGEDFTFLIFNAAENLIGFKIFVALVKAIAIAYLLHGALALVERMSVTLFDAAGGGAVAISKAPRNSPLQSLNLAGKATGAALSGAVAGAGAMRNAYNTIRNTGKSAEQEEALKKRKGGKRK